MAMDLTINSNNNNATVLTPDTDTTETSPPPTTTPPLRPNKHFSFSNGQLKRHSHPHHLQLPAATAAQPAVSFSYKECLKNHAASLGGHALDGCGEFMPSSSATPADPTSLRCAA